ncbi:MAG TPA: hypothetical protein VIS55_11825 [Pseudomonadales bacterium]
MASMRFPSLLMGLFMLCAMMASVAASAQAVYPEKIKTGTIQQLDFAAGSMIVDGYRYHTTPELRVEIAGSHGAFTMLEVGMKIRMSYLIISPSRRDLVEVVQIPDNVTLEEA